MYPIEYRWISVPMPVMNSTIAIDMRIEQDVERRRWKSPAGIQVKYECS